MKLQIRDATEEDVIPMVSWGKLMYEQSQFNKYDWDDIKVIGLVRMIIKDPMGIAVVAELEDSKQIVGGMIGMVREHFFGKDLEASDYAVFLAPEFRQSAAGFAVIKAYIKKATELGANEITLGNSTGNQPDRVAKLYEKIGFTRYGYNFRMQT